MKMKVEGTRARARFRVKVVKRIWEKKFGGGEGNEYVNKVKVNWPGLKCGHCIMSEVIMTLGKKKRKGQRTFLQILGSVIMQDLIQSKWQGIFETI